ncbi:MAG: two-component system sensor histidine kinase CreC [Verrucomicrobiales bacterium]|jgi:two-component system, OmpR family, sensor histidine kinase CreC|nr:two-component system sensor histidine kinase CreC [Verrucomicrobiales bacterium]MDP4791804.1 two-component system sensor histidine kinase CreC [Verrucomicrobiales bacterium]MDP5005919.1 two-component system sensor histidine kinase CreC [Verrucomicrobiales bacterium]
MKVTLLIVAGFLVIAGGGFFMLMRTLSEDIERQYSQASEEPLVDFAHLFAGLLEQEVRNGLLEVGEFRRGFADAYGREFVAKIYQLEKTKIHTQVYVTNEKGIVIFDSEGGGREGEDYSRYNDVFLARQGKYGARASRSDPEDSRTTVFYVAAPVTHEGRTIGTVTVSRPETAMAPFAMESRSRVVRSSIIMAVAVFLQAALWAYWVLYPIRHLTNHARRIAAGEQSVMPITGVAELRSLSAALEEMRAELEGRHYVENYVQALTHELKSPLAAIRGAAELIDENMPEERRRRFLDNILAETNRCEDMVRRLVQLAAIESRTKLATRESVQLGALVREELAGLHAALENRGLEVVLSGLNEGGRLDGDPLMLRIALRNVLNNAFDFSPSGGQVMISLTNEGSRLQLVVIDEGPGIPDYAGGRVFDRFYSLKNEFTGRKGSGIGLSFVKAAMDLHGGTATLKNRAEGGAEMTLRFGA